MHQFYSDPNTISPHCNQPIDCLESLLTVPRHSSSTYPCLSTAVCNDCIATQDTEYFRSEDCIAPMAPWPLSAPSDTIQPNYNRLTPLPPVQSLEILHLCHTSGLCTIVLYSFLIMDLLLQGLSWIQQSAVSLTSHSASTAAYT